MYKSTWQSPEETLNIVIETIGSPDFKLSSSVQVFPLSLFTSSPPLYLKSLLCCIERFPECFQSLYAVCPPGPILSNKALFRNSILIRQKGLFFLPCTQKCVYPFGNCMQTKDLKIVYTNEKCILNTEVET